MKTISTGLKAALQKGEIATLFSIVAQDGTAKYFTDHDKPLIVSGNTFIPSAGVTRIRMKVTNNAEVSNQEVAATVLDMPDDELKNGKWDNAEIEVAVCSWASVSNGKMVIFKGTIGVIQWTDEGFRADIQNYLRDLGKNIGTVVTGNCRHQLYSQSAPGKVGFCGVDPTVNKITGSISYVLTNRLKFKVNTTGKSDGWASAGFIKFTSGDNAGLTYEVKLHKVEGGDLGESIELYLPTIATLQVGNTFELQAGCDHTFTTCKSKFNNGANFGGFPHIQVDTNARIENN